MQSSRQIRLAGRYVALVLDYDDKYQLDNHEIGVWDLSEGRARYCLPTYAFPAVNDQGGPYYVDTLRVSARGAIAWQEQDTHRPSTTSRISTYDANEQHVLDSGGFGELSSLSLRGETLFWLFSGTPRSATLGGAPPRHRC